MPRKVSSNSLRVFVLLCVTIRGCAQFFAYNQDVNSGSWSRKTRRVYMFSYPQVKEQELVDFVAYWTV
jgi:hypothetical protein